MSGWAVNREDGTAEAVFEGEEVAVESMVDYCRQGPGRAEVARLEVTEEEPEGEGGFLIR